MLKSLETSRIAWLVAGLIVGAVALLVVPHRPLDAVATDRQENFAIATGPVDEDIEAVYFLDFLTGSLKAAVLSTATGTFMSAYETNVLNDLGVEPDKQPKYLMVTGLANLRRTGGTFQPGLAVVYVAEVTSGKVAAYAIPYSRGQANVAKPVRGSLIKLDVIPFRTAAVRGQ
jgi:hypothetical protein